MQTGKARRLCVGTTRTGEPCRSHILVDGNYCIAHSPNPEHKAKQRKIVRSGGYAKATSIRSAKEWQQLARNVELQDLPALLVGAGLAVLDGKMEPARLTALATAVRAATSVAEVVMLEARLRELERLFGEEQ